jgi:hypothetical protein
MEWVHHILAGEHVWYRMEEMIGQSEYTSEVQIMSKYTLGYGVIRALKSLGNMSNSTQ